MAFSHSLHWITCRAGAAFGLAFPWQRSDESSCAKRRKGFTTMKNVAATTTEQTATVAEQGAPVAPEKAASKKGATQKKDAPKGQKTAKGGKAQAAAPKKESKASKKAAKPATAKEVGLPKGASIPNQEIATEIVPHNEPPPARVGGFLRLRLFEG
jgi:hypothetical protein